MISGFLAGDGYQELAYLVAHLDLGLDELVGLVGNHNCLSPETG